MSRKSNAAVKVEVIQTQPTEIVISGLAELKAKETELRAKKRLLMEVEARNAWEQETKARNPQYVVGSLRAATPEDAEVLGYSHGQVCLIKCEACGTERLVNKQDAGQVRYCQACKKAADSTRNKERRVAERLARVSPEDLQRQIEALNAQLAKLS
jgi:hypothetical protein